MRCFRKAPRHPVSDWQSLSLGVSAKPYGGEASGTPQRPELQAALKSCHQARRCTILAANPASVSRKLRRHFPHQADLALVIRRLW
jgi:hypothetical protein